jgi:hypothetical protein
VRRYLEGCTWAAFWRGSRVMVAKVASHISYRPTWKHVGVAVGVTYLLWPTVAKVLARVRPVLPTVLTVSAVVWVVAAMVIGSSAAAAKPVPGPAPDTEQAEDEQPVDERQDPPAEATLYALIEHVAALSDQGTAAHLPDLLDEGRKRGLFGGWEQADLKAHLTTLGAPVVAGKKLTFRGRQRNRQAVLLDGLPEAVPAPVPTLVRGAHEGTAGPVPEPAPPAAPAVPPEATGSR